MAKEDKKKGLSRRDMLGTTAAVAAAGATGVAGGVALTQNGRDHAGRGADPAGRPGRAARGRQQVRGEAGRARRVLRVLLERPDRRGPHHRPAVHARADAHSGVQPRQRHRLGPDQREPQGAHRGPDAREPRVPEGPGRHLHQRRPPPSASVLHGRHLRRALPVRQRQVEHARLPHPSRRDEVRQDHPAPEPVDGARPARAEVPADRLRVLQRRGPGAGPERRQDPRRSEEVLARCSRPSTATR